MSKPPSDLLTPPDPLPVFYLDENLASKALADELRRFANDWTIEQHYDHFKRGKTPDLEVIAKCAECGWTILSCDDRLRVMPQNRNAILKQKVRAFMFPEGNYQGTEYRSALVTARFRLIKLVGKTAAPCFGRIYINGHVSLILDKPARQLTSREKTMRKYGADVFSKVEGV